MALNVGAELFPLGEHFVELMLSQHGTQGRLRQHVGGRKIVLNLNNRVFGIDDIEIEYRVDFHRDVVARDHILARNLDDLDAQIHAHHFLDEGNQQHQSRPFDPLETPERKDHGALVFAQDLHARHDEDDGDQRHNRQDQHA